MFDVVSATDHALSSSIVEVSGNVMRSERSVLLKLDRRCFLSI